MITSYLCDSNAAEVRSEDAEMEDAEMEAIAQEHLLSLLCSLFVV